MNSLPPARDINLFVSLCHGFLKPTFGSSHFCSSVAVSAVFISVAGHRHDAKHPAPGQCQERSWQWTLQLFSVTFFPFGCHLYTGVASGRLESSRYENDQFNGWYWQEIRLNMVQVSSRFKEGRHGKKRKISFFPDYSMQAKVSVLKSLIFFRWLLGCERIRRLDQETGAAHHHHKKF